jgi:DNA-binding response OmpR family regulator
VADIVMKEPVVHIEGLRVLVVEDDPEHREALEEAVRCLGHSCTTARDGVEAWEIYAADGADIILSDWQMPRMDGFDLCQKVRANLSNAGHTHFIFVTADDDDAHFIRGVLGGADAYIAKPVDLDELEACLAITRQRVILDRQLAAAPTSLPFPTPTESGLFALARSFTRGRTRATFPTLSGHLGSSRGTGKSTR